MEGVRSADPAWKAARVVVRRHLDGAAAACRRLSDPADVEALHDFRVALRRLRAALKAYAPVLKPVVPKGLREALGVLADRTGPARDAEVFVEWLSEKAPRIAPRSRKAALWLLAQMESRRDAAYRSLRRLIPKVFGLIEPLLRAGLAVRPGAGRDRGLTFGAFTGKCAEEHLSALSEALGRIRGVDDAERAHRARIAAKKLRYLLEPALSPQGAGILKPLKAVQDDLGRFHDVGAVIPLIDKAQRWRRGVAGDGRAAPPPATLLGVRTSADRERTALFRAIKRDFLRGSGWLAPVVRWTRRHDAQSLEKTAARGSANGSPSQAI